MLEENVALLDEHLRLQKLPTRGREVELSRLRAEKEELLHQRLDLLLHKAFGAKSESLHPAQLELLFQDGDASKKFRRRRGRRSPAAGPPAATAAQARSTRSTRKPRDLSPSKSAKT